MALPSDDLDEEALSLLALSLPAVPPSAAARARMLAALEGESRYVPFATTLARLFDLPEVGVRALLARAADPAEWREGFLPVERFLHFDAGPAMVGLRAGLVQMLAGTEIPAHRHREREITLVLEGALTDGDGRAVGPGEWLDMPAGSVHSLRIDGDRRSVLAVLRGGIELLG
ncbi:MAG: cupin domain-containing protein [Deltaproteobacteria bacterium]|nr:cupin domain-containing protein [Deltaproteobacteria bacterium]